MNAVEKLKRGLFAIAKHKFLEDIGALTFRRTGTGMSVYLLF